MRRDEGALIARSARLFRLDRIGRPISLPAGPRWGAILSAGFMGRFADLLRRHASAGTRRTLRRLADGARTPMPRRERHAAGAPAPSVALPEDVLDCVIAFNEHGAYCVPRCAQHRPAAQAILTSRVWEAETIALIRDTEGSVVHAGTFFGDFLPALALSRPRGTVWAFEPNRENYRCAQVTLLLNGLENVRLVRAGLSSKSGAGFVQTINRGGRPLGGGSRLTAPVDGLGEEVPLVSIDEAVEGPVSVIQLDVERHEQSALTGALETVRQYRPLLLLESLPDPEWLARHLAPLGYRRAGSVNANHVLRADHADDLTTPHGPQANVSR
jgi:FkbM family methyltransferase